MRNTEDLLAGTKRMLEDLTEQLREEIEAHSRTKSMAKIREAEFKIFEQAETGHEQRAKDLLANLDSSERKRELEAERWLHARKLIVALEDLHWERATSQSSYDADGWREWLQRFSHSSDRLVLEFELSCRLKKRYSSESALVGSINVHLVVFVPQVLQ